MGCHSRERRLFSLRSRTRAPPRRSESYIRACAPTRRRLISGSPSICRRKRQKMTGGAARHTSIIVVTYIRPWRHAREPGLEKLHRVLSLDLLLHAGHPVAGCALRSRSWAGYGPGASRSGTDLLPPVKYGEKLTDFQYNPAAINITGRPKCSAKKLAAPKKLRRPEMLRMHQSSAPVQR